VEEVIKYASNQYVLIERERLERLELVAECARDVAYTTYTRQELSDGARYIDVLDTIAAF